jgi:hypothetical protein
LNEIDPVREHGLRASVLGRHPEARAALPASMTVDSPAEILYPDWQAADVDFFQPLK